MALFITEINTFHTGISICINFDKMPTTATSFSLCRLLLLRIIKFTVYECFFARGHGEISPRQQPITARDQSQFSTSELSPVFSRQLQSLGPSTRFESRFQFPTKCFIKCLLVSFSNKGPSLETLDRSFTIISVAR